MPSLLSIAGTGIPLLLAVGFTWANFYTICLGVGVGYVLIVALLGAVGGDSDHDLSDFDHDIDFDADADVDFDADVDAGVDFDADADVAVDHGAVVHHGGGWAHLGPFSPLIIALFLTCFGGAGVVFTTALRVEPPALSVVPSAGGAILFAAAAIWAFNRLFRRVESSSHATASDLLGRSARVTVTIPQGRGAGAIAYNVKGTRYTAVARSEDAVSIPQGADVVILRLAGRCVFVAPPEDKRARAAMKRRARADAAC
jgi:membrane protein implicated in regulation of membrane protease activity